MEILHRKLQMITRPIFDGYPAIAVTGPRQSGKTTFVQAAFPDRPYVNFESPIERADFDGDPIGFLDRFPAGAILDEVQLVPEILSHLQVRIDREGRMGRWVLTGSQQLDSGSRAAQSLAGRVALLELLPFSYSETRSSPRAPNTLSDAVFRGGYPPLYDADRKLEPVRWLEDYLSTFVARDVRTILDVRNRSAFDRFLRHCAARTGHVLNVAGLARDVGLDQKTVSGWLSVLEACYVIRLLRPHHRNFGKRLVKAPKLYFIDSGLACRLLHISDVNQLRGHPQWGALVETWCFSEVLKARLHRGLPPDLWFWGSSDGYEVDIVLDRGDRLIPIEIKAAATPHPDYTRGLVKLRELSHRDSDVRVSPGLVVYGGSEARQAREERFVPWSGIEAALDELG